MAAVDAATVKIKKARLEREAAGTKAQVAIQQTIDNALGQIDQAKKEAEKARLASKRAPLQKQTKAAAQRSAEVLQKVGALKQKKASGATMSEAQRRAEEAKKSLALSLIHI
eukprot:TRINITY_DN3570_c0_g1_i2.p2 TRINITY_DN3570_c0_g1~~TRINITY_DN3570_c0_g1_i2.p2  ORF type:complete len:112 (-),score=52.76 TRINITY_DN3570_c0_g1_i2:195-530(-)